MTQIDQTRTRSAVRRTELDLGVLQVQAIDTFTEHLREAQAAVEGATSREARMDAARLRDVLRREREALVDHCDRQQLSTSLKPALALADHRVVIAHRHEWFTAAVVQALESGGVRVAAVLQNGADAIGVAVAEQPDLMLVEDTLPMVTSVQVVQEVLRFSPGTRVAAQVRSADGMPALLDAGAESVFVRNVLPADVAAALLGLLELRAD